MLMITAVLLCTIGLAFGNPSFTAVSPADAIIRVDQNITVRCDSNNSVVQPAVTSTNNDVIVDNITPSGTAPNIRIFQASSFSRSDNGTVLRCKDPDNVLIGSIPVIVLYEPLITGLNNITVTEGQQVSFNVTIDANPPVGLLDISIAPNLPGTTMFNLVDANTVSVTIPSVTVSNAKAYTITASNSEGNDTQSFVLTVNQVSPTSTQATTGTTSESVTAMTETTTSTSSVASSTGTATMTTTPSASPSSTDDPVQGSSNMKLASAVTVLILIIIVFLF